MSPAGDPSALPWRWYRYALVLILLLAASPLIAVIIGFPIVVGWGLLLTLPLGALTLPLGALTLAIWLIVLLIHRRARRSLPAVGRPRQGF